MAYDPEARQTSNMALVVGIIVLVLIVGGAIAYLTTRPGPVETAPPTIIHNQAPAPAPQMVPVPVPSNPPPTVTINPPSPSTSTTTTTTIEKKETAPPADKADSGTIDSSKADQPSDKSKSSTSSTTTTTTSPSGY